MITFVTVCIIIFSAVGALLISSKLCEGIDYDSGFEGDNNFEKDVSEWTNNNSKRKLRKKI